LDVSAECSPDNSKLVLKVVNLGGFPETATIILSGFTPTNPIAAVQVLAAPQSAVNTAQATLVVTPANTNWQHNYNSNSASYTFTSNSITTIIFKDRRQPRR
jgi:hypothetical protein